MPLNPPPPRTPLTGADLIYGDQFAIISKGGVLSPLYTVTTVHRTVITPTYCKVSGSAYCEELVHSVTFSERTPIPIIHRDITPVCPPGAVPKTTRRKACTSREELRYMSDPTATSQTPAPAPAPTTIPAPEPNAQPSPESHRLNLAVTLGTVMSQTDDVRDALRKTHDLLWSGDFPAAYDEWVRAQRLIVRLRDTATATAHPEKPPTLTTLKGPFQSL